MFRYGAVLCFCAYAVASVPEIDADRDGLPDAFEQAILARFVPSFQISAAECDEAPASFESGSGSPHVVKRDDTLYGQVSRSALSRNGSFLELHYYHLWRQDCGRRGHPLDAEHVSVLLRSDQIGNPAALWKAVYWYASAHQDTLCDVSHAVKAVVIGAEDAGASVWISAGKHASFLTEEQCRRSCGADQCDSGRKLIARQVINIGEQNEPMNGALWAQSKAWPLSTKMKPDFTETVVARMEDSTEVVPVNGSKRSVRAVISAGDSSMGAVGNATAATDRSLRQSRASTGNVLKRAHEKVKGWLGSGK